MCTHSNCLLYRFRDHLEFLLGHGISVIQCSKLDKVACISRRHKDRVSNLLVLIVLTFTFLANDKFTRHLIYPSPPSQLHPHLKKNKKRYLSKRALIALMSIPELLLLRPLMPPTRDPSGTTVEVGRRWTWVGWERMLTDFDNVDREFASAGISSSNSSTCASRSYPDFAAMFRKCSGEQSTSLRREQKAVEPSGVWLFGWEATLPENLVWWWCANKPCYTLREQILPESFDLNQPRYPNQ